MFASILSVAHNIGYPTLVLLIMAESSGVPLPGETALITGAVLASQHRLYIALVIASAAAGAILGDNAGYLIGRKGGRWLLLRPGPFARHRARVLEIGEPFFASRGSKAVFLGRWISACAPGPRGSPGRATCRGARSHSGTLPAGSAGRQRSAWSPTTLAEVRAAPSPCSGSRDSQAHSPCPACCSPGGSAADDANDPSRPPARPGRRRSPRRQSAPGVTVTDVRAGAGGRSAWITRIRRRRLT
jgi:membrane protein YqaA with SNARE-associated domain